jgi:hypothetical protein
MFILNFALVAFLFGGGIITLTNWITERLEKNTALSNGQ